MRTFRMASTSSQALNRTALHKPDYMYQLRKVGRTAAVFFPFYATVLGWPVSFPLFSSISFSSLFHNTDWTTNSSSSPATAKVLVSD